MQLQCEAAMPNSLGDAFTRKYIRSLTLGHTKCCPVPSTSCDLFRCNVKVATSNGLGGNTFTRNETEWPADFGTKLIYSKTCLKRPLKKKTKIVFKTAYRLMQVKVLQNTPRVAFCNTLAFIKPLLVIKIFALFIFELPL